MSTSVLAAGCMISNSFMIVAPSLEMVTPCRQRLLLQRQMAGTLHCRELVSQGSHPLSVYEFVHATWPKCRSYSIYNSHTSIDIADELRFSLAGICAFLEQNDLWLLQEAQNLIIWLIIARLGVDVHLREHEAR